MKSPWIIAFVCTAFISSATIVFADCNRVEGCYGALAAGTWRDSNAAARVGAGSAVNLPSEQDARNAAMRKCNELAYNCKIVGTFSMGGCGYITTGQIYNGVRWASGATPNDALSECRRNGGYDCKTPIGGCTASPDLPSNDPDEELGD